MQVNSSCPRETDAAPSPAFRRIRNAHSADGATAGCALSISADTPSRSRLPLRRLENHPVAGEASRKELICRSPKIQTESAVVEFAELRDNRILIAIEV